MASRGWGRPPEDTPQEWIEQLRIRTHDLATEIAKLQLRLLRLERARAQRDAEIARVISHTVIVLALLAAYVAVTLHGDDGAILLGLLGGYIGGAAVEKASTSRARK